MNIQGKVIVIKTFLVSQLVYVMQSIGLPRLSLQKINRILYTFCGRRRSVIEGHLRKLSIKCSKQNIARVGLA